MTGRNLFSKLLQSTISFQSGLSTFGSRLGSKSIFDNISTTFQSEHFRACNVAILFEDKSKSM